MLSIQLMIKLLANAKKQQHTRKNRTGLKNRDLGKRIISFFVARFVFAKLNYR